MDWAVMAKPVITKTVRSNRVWMVKWLIYCGCNVVDDRCGGPGLK